MGHYLSEMLHPEPWEGPKTVKTFTIKPNDEVTLKEDLQCYVNRISGFAKSFTLKSKRKDMCKDPDYVLDYMDMLNFRGKIVVVEDTYTKPRFDNNGKVFGYFYYITVRNRAGDSLECPIEFIDRASCLRRNHKRIILHHKILVCN